MYRLLAFTVLAGCGFTVTPGSVTPHVDADPDALGTEPGMPTDAVDAPPTIDAPPGMNCYGSFESVCLTAAPQGPINVIGSSLLPIDTDTSTLCQSPASGSSLGPACILAAATISINGTLRATGSKPLILIGTTSITVNGGSLIDVASRGFERGAGARACPPGGGAGGNAGGHGASFGTLGGIGGAGGSGMAGGVPQVIALTDLLGGCTGAPGGGSGVTPGLGGLGGGAVLLIGTAVIINGTINASGGGASGGVTGAGGGGGGGSGGAIVVDSQNVSFNGGAFLYAQGGGGGEGASVTTTGAPGGVAPTPGGPAIGGRNVNSQGGDGGNGAVSSSASGGNSGNDGGGGGGGGAGHIKITDGTFTDGGSTYPPWAP